MSTFIAHKKKLATASNKQKTSEFRERTRIEAYSCSFEEVAKRESQQKNAVYFSDKQSFFRKVFFFILNGESHVACVLNKNDASSWKKKTLFKRKFFMNKEGITMSSLASICQNVNRQK